MDQNTINAYLSGATLPELSQKYDIWPEQIKRFLVKSGVTIRPKGRRKGTQAWNKWKPSSKKKDNTELIESGEYKKLSESSVRSRVKRYLITKHGHTCMICKLSIWNEKPIPLVCDHIDGNSSNPDLINFRLICCNCDAQLDTYKSKNRGNGRKYDREYYQKTK